MRRNKRKAGLLPLVKIIYLLKVKNFKLRARLYTYAKIINDMQNELDYANERLEEKSARADAFEELFEQQRDKTRELMKELKFYQRSDI